MNHHDFIAITSGCELIASAFGDEALQIYVNRDGAYIAARIVKPTLDEPQNNYAAAVCADVIDVIEFFGDGKLAMELYAAADKALGLAD